MILREGETFRKGVQFDRDIQDISSTLLPAEAPEALAPPLTPVNSVRSPLYPPYPTQIRLVISAWGAPPPTPQTYAGALPGAPVARPSSWLGRSFIHQSTLVAPLGEYECEPPLPASAKPPAAA